MLYFKWGISRLILEADICPDVVPFWIEGIEQVMHESRGNPRWLPRWGKDISVTFGDRADVEAEFGDVRRRWKKLVQDDSRQRLKNMEASEDEERLDFGVLSEGLKYGREAVELRKETTMIVRKLVLELRKQRGLPDEDPKAGLVDTYKNEGKREGTVINPPQEMEDGSWVRDD